MEFYGVFVCMCITELSTVIYKAPFTARLFKEARSINDLR